VSLLRKCLAAWEHGDISAVIDLCDESDELLVHKEYVERHPVHHAVMRASDIASLKPVIREHAPELLIKEPTFARVNTRLVARLTLSDM